MWNHTIDQSFDTKDFVFAVSVDTKFSVADSMADEAENYETYSKLMFPMLAGAIFGSVLWLIGMVWLTVTAGRRPEDEEIHLNGFDRWYTEIAAGTLWKNSLIRKVLKWIGKCSGKLADFARAFPEIQQKK